MALLKEKVIQKTYSDYLDEVKLLTYICIFLIIANSEHIQ